MELSRQYKGEVAFKKTLLEQETHFFPGRHRFIAAVRPSVIKDQEKNLRDAAAVAALGAIQSGELVCLHRSLSVGLWCPRLGCL